MVRERGSQWGASCHFIRGIAVRANVKERGGSFSKMKKERKKLEVRKTN